MTTTRIQTRLGGAGAIATDVAAVLAASGKAYVGGVLELGRTLMGFGRDDGDLSRSSSISPAPAPGR